MKKFFMIVGIIVVAWLVLSLLGSIIWGLTKLVFWIAVIVGIAYIVASFVARKQMRQR